LLDQESEQSRSLSVGKSCNSEQLLEALDIFLGDIDWYVSGIICHGGEDFCSANPAQFNLG